MCIESMVMHENIFLSYVSLFLSYVDVSKNYFL